MEKDIHASHKEQGAATNREKGQGVTRTRAGAAPCKNGLARTLTLMHWMSVKLPDNFQIREHSWPCLFHIDNNYYYIYWTLFSAHWGPLALLMLYS